MDEAAPDRRHGERWRGHALPAAPARASEGGWHRLTSGGRWNVAIVLLALFVIGAIWIMTLERIDYERSETVKSVIVQNSNLAIALEEHAVRTFKSASQALAQVARGHPGSGGVHDIADLVRAGAIDHSIFTVIGVADESGGPLHDSLNSLSSADFTGLDFFESHRAAETGKLFIGKPLLGPISGEWAIPVSRRISKPDGSFGGVAFAGIHPHYFTEFYRQAHLGVDGVMMLVGLDGIARARQAWGSAGTFGHDMTGSTLLAEQGKSTSGSYLSQGRGRIETTRRYYSYRTLAQFPFVVAVGKAEPEVLEAFWERRRLYFSGSAAASAFIAMFAGLLMLAMARQRRVVRALGESERRYSEMLGNVQMISLMLDREARITYCNDYLLKLTGWDRVEIIGKSWFELFIPPEEREMGAVFDDLLRDAPSAWHHQNEILTRCGERRLIQWNNTVLRSASQDIVGTASIGLDVTEREQTRAELEFKNLVLTTEQQASPDAILVVDESARIVSYNPQFLKLWSLSDDVVRAGNNDELLPLAAEKMADPDGFLARVRHLHEHRGESSSEELALKDGRTIDRYSAPMTGPNGRYYGRVWYFRDVTERRRTLAALRQSHDLLTATERIAAVGGFEWDLVNDVLFWSQETCRMYGRAREGHAPTVAEFMASIHPDDAGRVRETIAAGLAGEKPFDIEFRIVRPDGTERIVHSQGEIERDHAGTPLRMTGTSHDITERKRAEEASRLSAKAFESIADGIIITDASRRIVYANSAFTHITGYSRAEILGKTPRFLQSGRHDAAFYAAMWAEIERDGHWRGEVWDRNKRGEIYPALLRISAVRDGTGTITHYVGVTTDMSSLKDFEEQLQHQANHDALTGLANRSLLQERFRETLNRARRHNHRAAVLFLDLDHFKNINDSLGHASGDLLLQAAAQRLKSHVREIDTVARFGGDEFAVLLDTIDDNQDAGAVAQKLIDALAQPFQIKDHHYYISASIGIGCYPQDGGDVDTLLKNADTAMYRAKAEGRNNQQFFSVEMNAQALEKLHMSSSLRLALERKEFLLHYQPRLDLATGRITGAEALIRWRHPELGMISPARFIPIAEENGLIEPIGEWVLGTACRQMRAWRDAGLPLDRMAVNLSARQFSHPDLLRRIAVILEETGLPARYLEVEVTESMVMRDPEATAGVLSKLKALGIAVSIDDFGTGYSSLSYLKRFPLDFLKIDQSFVRGIPSDADDAAIIAAIIAMAKSLKLKLIAEGVETAAQRDFLTAQGCDEAQGYLFARPVPASELEILVSEGAAAGLALG